jgi:glutamate decarboxylase
MLATLSMKKKWANKRKAEGKPFDKPNLVMSSAVQVCWEKGMPSMSISAFLNY